LRRKAASQAASPSTRSSTQPPASGAGAPGEEPGKPLDSRMLRQIGNDDPRGSR
jgi:hypothetical protein